MRPRRVLLTGWYAIYLSTGLPEGGQWRSVSRETGTILGSDVRTFGIACLQRGQDGTVPCRSFEWNGRAEKWRRDGPRLG